MPYPNGITHALLMLRSLDTHKLSIGLELRKNVAPGCFPVCWITAFLRLSPSLSESALPEAPVTTCLLWSIKRIILLPVALQSFICFNRCVFVFLASGYNWVTVMHEIPISSAQPTTSFHTLDLSSTIPLVPLERGLYHMRKFQWVCSI
jgi:hypothetical protein